MYGRFFHKIWIQNFLKVQVWTFFWAQVANWFQMEMNISDVIFLILFCHYWRQLRYFLAIFQQKFLEDWKHKNWLKSWSLFIILPYILYSTLSWYQNITSTLDKNGYNLQISHFFQNFISRKVKHMCTVSNNNKTDQNV